MLEWLFDRFASVPKKPAMIWHDREYSYAWLLDRVGGREDELARRSVGTGAVFSVEGDYSPDVCALLLALFDRAAIVVPLSSAVASNVPHFQQIAEVQAGVRFHPEAEAGWEFFERRAAVEHPLTRSLIELRRPGLVLFSSGSTGPPKAILHDFARLAEKFKVVRHSYRTLALLLVDHIGGINTLFYTLSNLGTIVSVRQQSPDAVCAAIERHRVELLPSTPTFLNLLLLSEAHRRYDLSSLRLITYGTEIMPETTLRRIHELFPDVKLLQTYGMSELGILRSKSRDSNSLWMQIGGEGFETKVVDRILHIRAQSAMMGYLNAPSPFDDDGWFNTGDEVELDGEYVRFLGRRSEIINVGGEKVYPAEVENVLLRMPNLRDVVVTGEPNPLTGQIVAAYFRLKEPEQLPALRSRMREHCRGLLEPYKIPAKVEIVAEEQYSERFKKVCRRPAPSARL